MSSSFLAAAASRSSDNVILTDTAESLKNALDNGALTPADYAKRARQAGVEVANGFCMSAMAACTKAGTLWGPVVHHYPP